MIRKKIILALSFVFCSLAGFAQARQILPVSGEWSFYKGDVKSNRPDVSAWDKVTIPHTWNKEDGTGSSNNNYYRGAGVYSKNLHLPKEMKNKSIYVRFEAVSSIAEVYVNGRYVGKHEGAFNAFCFDITRFVKIGENNQLVVKATNEWDKNVIPLAGDFTVFGGIYRPVSLIVLNPVNITPLDFASSGVYVKQTEVDDSQATLDITTKLNNETDVTQPVDVKFTLLNQKGAVEQAFSQRIVLSKKSKKDILQQLVVTQPLLWNGRKNPYMYTLQVEVLQNGRLLDEVKEKIGLRYFHIDPQKGFFLNGDPYNLRGVNRHQDREGSGWAITNKEHDEDVALIKEIGANGIRLAHYPHSNYFYSLCDEAGILVWAEIPFIERATYTPEFLENAKLQLEELIRQSYNRPSIFCWGLFNELSQGEPHEIVKELNDLAHRTDPTRFTVSAPNHEKRPENLISDYLAYNTYPGWYWATPDAMGGSLENWNRLGGEKGICVSEYGAGASVFHHEQNVNRAPKTDGPWHPEEWQSWVHEENYRQIDDRKFVWGSFVWNMFDFAVASRNEGDRRGINDKGLVTYDRKTKKDAFYFYKANWSEEPVLYITSRRHVERNEAITDIKVYSNARGLILYVNDECKGSVCAENGVFVWKEIQLKPGKNVISVSGRKGETIISDTCEWTLK